MYGGVIAFDGSVIRLHASRDHAEERVGRQVLLEHVGGVEHVELLGGVLPREEHDRLLAAGVVRQPAVEPCRPTATRQRAGRIVRRLADKPVDDRIAGTPHSGRAVDEPGRDAPILIPNSPRNF